MKKTTTLLATAAFALTSAIPAFADDEGFAAPGFTAAIDYSSRQVTRGLIDNEEGIATLSGAVEWMGFTFEVDGIFNTTDEMEEDGFDAWDNTEVDFIVGYGYTFGADDFSLPTDVEVGIDYTYEWDNDGDLEDSATEHFNYLHASIGLPEIPLSPTLAAEWMLDQFHGQYYSLEFSHTFELVAGEGEDADPEVGLTLSLLQGLADKKYDDDDLGKDFWALRDTTLTATIDWIATGNLTVSPYIAYTDTFSGTVRDAAKCDKHGDAGHVFGGITVSASF